MMQISPGSVLVGDVLYHPAMGFAEVARREDDTLLLAWEQDGRKGLPRRVRESSAVKGWRRCRPEGFFCRSVKEPKRLRKLLHQDGREALRLLLEDLVEPQDPADIGQWLSGRELLDEAEFEHWWSRLDPEHDPLFVFRHGRLGLSGMDEDTAPMEFDRPWVERGALIGVPLVHAAMELCGLLAREHARGEGAGLARTNLVLEDGQLHILPGQPTTRTADVYQAGLILLERAMGRPLPKLLSPEQLMPWLAELTAPISPSALPLLEKMLSPQVDTRPPSAVRLFPEWAAAAATEDLRRVAHPGRQRFHIGADTHIGRVKMRGQQANQDFMAVEAEGDQTLVVVCDGISTSDAGTGDRASRIATDVLTDAWHRRPKRLSRDLGAARDFLNEALSEANTRVCEAALQEAGGNLRHRIPMGTTLVMALVHGPVVDLAWLGDSRAYWVGATGAACLTADHNVLLDWLDRRRERNERNAHMGKTLTRYIGHFDDRTPALLPVQHRRLQLLAGESLVLLTDGVSDFGAPTHRGFADLLTRTLAAYPDPGAAATRLIQAANDGGGGDNATAVVMRLSSSA